MKKIYLLIFTSSIFLTSCAGGNSPGYLFHIIFIIAPIILIGHYLNKKIDSSSETLYVLEGQLKRVIGKLEKLEEELSGSSGSKSSKSGSKKKKEDD